MVFLGGPRQVGKTTLSRTLFAVGSFDYLNWDIDAHRSRILTKEFKNVDLIIFDELHKYKKWRNYLKGIFDQIRADETEFRKILVTGSARLDYYRYGGDSLQGRYNYFRLLPFSFDEIKGKNQSDLLDLLNFSGFPEPFLSGSVKECRRWSNQYLSRLVREDIVDLEKVTDLGSIEVLAKSLNQHVGSPLSINNLRENLGVAHETVTKWIQVLERLYLVFRIPPFTGNLLKSVKKEQKLYFFNWTYVSDEGLRFENLVALHLLKYCFWLQDIEGRNINLYFTKQKDQGELDFVVCEDNVPSMFVEVKLSDQEINPRLFYFKTKYPKAEAFQIHLKGKKSYRTPQGIQVMSAVEFFKEHVRTSAG